MEPCEFPHIEEQLTPILVCHGRDATRLLQILRDVQDHFHFIPPEAIAALPAT